MSDAIVQRNRPRKLDARALDAHTSRPLPAGYGLILAVAISAGLWFGLVWGVVSLTANGATG